MQAAIEVGRLQAVSVGKPEVGYKERRFSSITLKVFIAVIE